MLRYVVFCFAVLASVHGDTKFSDDDKKAIHALLKPIVLSCMEKLGVDTADFEAGKMKDDPNPCVVACVLRRTGALDDKGMYDSEGSVEFMKKAVTDEDKIKEATEATKICDKVNKEDVTDGEEGCERAILVVKCFKELKNDYVVQ